MKSESLVSSAKAFGFYRPQSLHSILAKRPRSDCRPQSIEHVSSQVTISGLPLRNMPLASGWLLGGGGSVEKEGHLGVYCLIWANTMAGNCQGRWKGMNKYYIHQGGGIYKA